MTNFDESSKYRNNSLPNNVNFLQDFFQAFEHCGNLEESDVKVEKRAKLCPFLSELEKRSLKNLIGMHGINQNFLFYIFPLKEWLFFYTECEEHQRDVLVSQPEAQNKGGINFF